MKKIEAIRNYFDVCPLLDSDAKINIDYLGPEAVEYGIYSDPIDPYYKKYVDGGGVKQFGFTFSTMSYYTSELMQQLENSSFFEEFQSWIEKNNQIGFLPEIKGAIKIEILTNGYLINVEADTAQYQIQLKLLYTEE